MSHTQIQMGKKKKKDGKKGGGGKKTIKKIN
jgi:hypothetical protein